MVENEPQDRVIDERAQQQPDTLPERQPGGLPGKPGPHQEPARREEGVVSNPDFVG